MMEKRKNKKAQLCKKRDPKLCIRYFLIILLNLDTINNILSTSLCKLINLVN